MVKDHMLEKSDVEIMANLKETFIKNFERLEWFSDSSVRIPQSTYFECFIMRRL